MSPDIQSKITSHLIIIEHSERPSTYDIGNLSPGLGQAQKWGGVKPV